MRPTRLELQGFASFRTHTVIDFGAADLFVLSGPTGAGKSSIIDAMTFALYGSVARYGTRLVEPVISQGHRDARVLLDFTVDGAAYRVARVVQRTAAGGATTKEARLERLPAALGGDPVDLATGAKEVTAEVESLLGLTFEHFCRTVVLPQGAFQDFMHATAGERQELLVQLLDLGIYQQVQKLANARAASARGQVEALSEQLESVAGVSDEAIATVQARVEALAGVATVVAEAQPTLDAIRERGGQLRAVQTRATEDLARLDGIARPDGLGDLAERLAAADRAVTDAATALDRATAAREAAEDAAGEAVSSRDLATLAAALDQTTQRQDAVTAAGRRHEDAQEAAVTARKEADTAEADHADAQQRLEAAQTQHGVHALRPHLVVGEPCPLCDQDVATLPASRTPADLEQARAAVQAATRTAATAVAAANKAEIATAQAAEQVKAAEARLQDHLDQLTSLQASAGVDQQADAQAVRALEAAARDREAQLERLRTDERTGRTAVQQARQGAAALDGARTAAMEQLRAAQARVADLGAPAPSDDLAASWDALVAWVDQERPRRQEAVAAATADVDRAAADWTAHHQQLLDACTAAGVTVPKDVSPAAAVATATAEATAQADQLRARQQQARELGEKVERLKQDAAVAATLGRVLHANNFQKWLLSRGLTRLVVGASSILQDLSNGAYSLALADDNSFLVADHRNAGELRHTRSLSGGETFLASLALALSLADHVSHLAARGSARLESLFLDEGFGTLDADTLDVVASSIEELGASGRMVGLITHVPELATRLPVRFEVTKGPEGSRVERIEA